MGGRRNLFILFVILVLLAPIVGSASAGQIIHVKADGSGNYPTIQAAINASANGDVVIAAPGTYTGPGNRDINFFGKAITVTGTDPNDPNTVAETIIDCNKLGWAFYFHTNEDEESVIAGLTITKGSGDQGGAVYCYEATPTIANCSFTANFSPRDGGAMFLRAESDLRIINCTFIHNSTTGDGGAIFNYESSPLLINCILVENSAGENGGAIYNNSGIHEGRSDPTIVNCTISNNSAGFEGGGIGARGRIQDTGPPNPTLVNCILWSNTDKHGAIESSQIYIPSGGEAAISFSCIQGWTGSLPGTGNIDSDPGFVHPPTSDYHILPNSPCIDAGDPCFVPFENETDIDNKSRVIGDRVDIGADEFKEGPEPLIGISPDEFYIGVSSGDANPQVRTLSIRNLGHGILNWTINEDSEWLDVSPQSGQIGDDTNEVTLTAEWAGVPFGLHAADLVISADVAANSPLSISVVLHILDDDGQLHVPSGYATIQTAIDAARAGEAVVIAPGRYTGPGNRDLDFKGKAITVRSSDPCDTTIVEATVIDCQGTEADPHRAFIFHSGEEPNSIISGLTIENGYGPDAPVGYFTSAGGALFCLKSSPTITRCRIINNYASYKGGGMYCEDSKPVITDCLFNRNKAQYAGAIYNIFSGSLIEDCTFLANSTNNNGSYCFAGAIANVNASSPTIRRCSFIENRSYGNGGVFFNDGSGTKPTIQNCIFVKNEASGNGAGMFNYWSSQTTVTNCTFNQNVAHDGGGAIFHGKSETRTTVTNCILWGNSPTEIYADYSLKITYSNVKGGVSGQGNIDADPCFADVGAGDYHLSKLSPCINAGDPNFIAGPNETDIDGEVRVMLGRVDMGADEFNPFIVEFDIVEKRRIGRTVFEYDCKATLQNISRFAAKTIQLTLAEASSNMTIIQPDITFGDIEVAAGESATSVDTCTFRVDRSETIAPAEIIWHVTAELADSGAKMEHTLSSRLSLGPKAVVGFDGLREIATQWLWQGPAGGIEEDSVQDGTVNLLDFARLANNWLGSQ